MKMTAYEIWKIIHNTHPQDLMDKYGFDSTSEFKLIKSGEWKGNEYII